MSSLGVGFFTKFLKNRNGNDSGVEESAKNNSTEFANQALGSSGRVPNVAASSSETYPKVIDSIEIGDRIIEENKNVKEDISKNTAQAKHQDVLPLRQHGRSSQNTRTQAYFTESPIDGSNDADDTQREESEIEESSNDENSCCTDPDYIPGEEEDGSIELQQESQELVFDADDESFFENLNDEEQIGEDPPDKRLVYEPAMLLRSFATEGRRGRKFKFYTSPNEQEIFERYESQTPNYPIIAWNFALDNTNMTPGPRFDNRGEKLGYNKNFDMKQAVQDTQKFWPMSVLGSSNTKLVWDVIPLWKKWEKENEKTWLGRIGGIKEGGNWALKLWVEKYPIGVKLSDAGIVFLYLSSMPAKARSHLFPYNFDEKGWPYFHNKSVGDTFRPLKVFRNASLVELPDTWFERIPFISFGENEDGTPARLILGGQDFVWDWTMEEGFDQNFVEIKDGRHWGWESLRRLYLDEFESQVGPKVGTLAKKKKKDGGKAPSSLDKGKGVVRDDAEVGSSSGIQRLDTPSLSTSESNLRKLRKMPTPKTEEHLAYNFSKMVRVKGKDDIEIPIDSDTNSQAIKMEILEQLMKESTYSHNLQTLNINDLMKISKTHEQEVLAAKSQEVIARSAKALHAVIQNIALAQSKDNLAINSIPIRLEFEENPDFGGDNEDGIRQTLKKAFCIGLEISAKQGDVNDLRQRHQEKFDALMFRPTEGSMNVKSLIELRNLNMSIIPERVQLEKDVDQSRYQKELEEQKQIRAVAERYADNRDLTRPENAKHLERYKMLLACVPEDPVMSSDDGDEGDDISDDEEQTSSTSHTAIEERKGKGKGARKVNVNNVGAKKNERNVGGHEIVAKGAGASNKRNSKSHKRKKVAKGNFGGKSKTHREDIRDGDSDSDSDGAYVERKKRKTM